MQECEASLDLLVERLSDHGPPTAVADLVLAAVLGGDELDKVLGGEPGERPASQLDAAKEHEAIFLSAINVEGFRGIASLARLGLSPGPGLTLVVGRNGSGKSSFAEAAELALTGTASRWAKRPKVWSEGRACLHHDAARLIELRLAISGKRGETIVRRRWGQNDLLESGRSTAQSPGGQELPLNSLGLEEALITWRPFLSYNELGGLLEEGPSRLYDAISAVLGLEPWVEGTRRLDESRKSLDKAFNVVKKEAVRLQTLLTGLDDERAEKARSALSRTGRWPFDILESLSTGADHPKTEIALLEALSRIVAVDVAAAAERAEDLRRAAARADALNDGDAAHANELADLLDQALAVHRLAASETCPVCQTPNVLDASWVERTTAEISRLREEASTVVTARATLRNALEAARALITAAPAILLSGAPGVDCSTAQACWLSWLDVPAAPLEVAAHLDNEAPRLAGAVSDIRDAAAGELRRRQDAWQPVAVQMAAWLPDARRAEESPKRSRDLKQAADWLVGETNAVRNERFAPIAGQVEAIWEMLRQDSNVSLDAVSLEGKATSRRVNLSVSVDAVEGAALSVMSQGELHALALSLFLPRATLADSPFRFVLIDDPVQAMDAARVDGLARVLNGAAATHQVIVFTHDARLPDACRRLTVPAKVLEVTRGERSQVTIRNRTNPVENLLDDARAIICTDDMPEETRRRVVPGLCRQALESVCTDVTRRRLLGNGVPHAEIEQCLDLAGKLLPRLALALFGDAERAGEVLGTLKRRWGASAADCVTALNKGSHQLIATNPGLLVGSTADLAEALGKLQ
jgi:energy-coupling factor transporter ATP-binding protein EcfA2